jgi:SAM-dependent methyltransferase
MPRSPAPVFSDRDAALDLLPHEPPHDWLQSALSTIALPRSGQAVVCGARLGGTARRLAHALPSWLVTAVDPSVALLSASLDALRPAGLSCQVTVLHAGPTELQVPDHSADLVVGDFPLVHLVDLEDLARWADACAQALAPSGVLLARVARPDTSTAARTATLTAWPSPYADLMKTAWDGAFSWQDISTALRQASFRTIERHPAHAPFQAVADLLLARP